MTTRTMTRRSKTCPNCGGPLFENFVRRFREALASGKGQSMRTDYTDGRMCRKCKTFFPF